MQFGRLFGGRCCVEVLIASPVLEFHQSSSAGIGLPHGASGVNRPHRPLVAPRAGILLLQISSWRETQGTNAAGSESDMH